MLPEKNRKEKVSQSLFNKMTECGDWDSTVSLFVEETGQMLLWSEDVHGELSYQNQEEIVIVGARTCHKITITVQ